MSLDVTRLAERLPTTIDGVLLARTAPFWAGVAVYVAYLLTHPYPAFGAGLYLQTAEAVAANGYALPARIPGYTAGGIPFAYPPFAFYVLALLTDVAGADPLAVARFLPGVLVVACLVPYRGLASELTGSPRQAPLATVLLATAPPVLQWHLSAGGVVRAMAFLFALTSVYAAVWLFRTHSVRWLAVSTATFTLVVLTHPTYTVFAVLSYLVLYAGLDRSPRGLASGAVVGFGGLALATPWWLHVAAVHGVDVFFAASGTHEGLGTAPSLLWRQLSTSVLRPGVGMPFYLLVYAGTGYALWKRRFLLPAWLVATVFVIPKPRFLFVPGAILAAALVYEGIVPGVRRRLSSPGARRLLPTAVAVLVALAAVTVGTLYGAGLAPGIGGGPAQPQFVDAADEEAMAWIQEHTPPDATVVALGDAAEWLPFLADRTMLVGPWGVEWKGTDEYYAQYERFGTMSTCHDAACLERSLERAGVSPDYVYVPTGAYTVRDQGYVQPPSMVRSLAASPGFRVVFQNERVVIAAVVEERSPTGAGQPGDLDGEYDQDRQDADRARE